MLDRSAVRRRFSRAAPRYAEASRLEAEVGARMLQRLDYLKLAPRRVLDAGCGPGREARSLAARYPQAELLLVDLALPMLAVARARRGALARMLARNAPLGVCADAARLPLADRSVGLAWSNMMLHWVDDPVATLRELHRVLAIEGLLMFSTLGPDTLKELRAVAPARVHAFLDMHDYGDMLVAAGFSAPVMDVERLTMLYEDGAALLADLHAGGQTSARRDRARGLSGRGFRAALGAGLDAERRNGRLAVSYEVVYGHAWKAAPTRTADGRGIVSLEGLRRR